MTTLTIVASALALIATALALHRYYRGLGHGPSPLIDVFCCLGLLGPIWCIRISIRPIPNAPGVSSLASALPWLSVGLSAALVAWQLLKPTFTY